MGIEAGFGFDNQPFEEQPAGEQHGGENLDDPTSGIVRDAGEVDPNVQAEIDQTYEAGLKAGQPLVEVEGDYVLPPPSLDGIQALRTMLSGRMLGAEEASVGDLAALIGLLQGANPQQSEHKESAPKVPETFTFDDDDIPVADRMARIDREVDE